MPGDGGERRSLIRTVFSRRMLICVFNGISAGMPLFFVYHLIPAWLRSEQVDLKTIGLFSLVGIPYTWKFIWSPLMDRFVPPFLGRRRGWMLITQIALLLTMTTIGFADPQQKILFIAMLAFIVAFFSASQDIVLDAYRRELLPDNELGLGNSMYVNGYRAAVFIPGGLGLILADHLLWEQVFMVIGSFMVIGIIKTLLIKEIAVSVSPPRSLCEAVVKPFSEFFGREGGAGQGVLILAFLFLYKIGDNMATALSTPFYLDMGFSMTVIGTMVKLINFWAMIIGSFIGGVVIYKTGINRSLWLFGVVQMVSILGFAVLSESGANVTILGFVIGFEYLGVGLGTAALVAFMSRTTSMNFTATQFALFSSLIALPRTFANASTGFLIEGVGKDDGIYYSLLGAWDGLGYTGFFIFCTICAVPGMILLKWVAPWNEQRQVY
ncbi:MAG: AmpG family muropeptide MFS transporter [Proteobacteria bacterium]|nr:AmpG family muropeptide MFS transporter [Pseudomonadota bacterium]MBU1738416.1 AmpG family muropeptide MFS transporter [Pseudomonadota bacterium]